MNGLININKPKCATPLASLHKLRRSISIPDTVKIGYAGRLDPLASGVLLAMIGDTCRERDRFQALEKSYNFRVLLGVHTDSLDPLGIVDEIRISEADPSITTIRKILKKTELIQDQRIPLYSSYTINGTQMYKLARSGDITDIDRPIREISIRSLQLEAQTFVDRDLLIDRFLSEIDQVEGNFRQDDIISRWKSIKKELPSKLHILNCTATVSSGTYIRSIAEQIGTYLNTTAIAYDIVRTSVGKFSLSNSFYL